MPFYCLKYSPVYKYAIIILVKKNSQDTYLCIFL